MKNKLLLVGVAATILLGILVLVGVLSREPSKNDDNLMDDNTKDLLIRSIEISPVEDSSFGISKGTSFEVKTEGEFSEDEIKLNLKFEPTVKFDVIKKSKQIYEIKPIEPLVSNTLYALSYDEIDYGKAFQVAEDIEVYQSYPGNNARNLPSTTAIELKFNTNIDIDIVEYFSIEPDVEGTFKVNDSTLIFMPTGLEVNQTYSVTVKEGYSLENRGMEKPYAFTFETGYNDNFNTEITYNIKNSIKDEAPIVSINSYELESSYKVEIFNALDFDKFSQMYQDFLKSKSSLDTIELPEFFNSKVQPIVNENNQFVELPKLDDGYYIVKIAGKNSLQYVFLQIGPHDIYYNENKNGVLLWVVDKNTGELVEGVEININNVKVGTTDDQGIYIGEPVEKIKEVMISVGDHSYLINHIGAFAFYDYFDYYYDRNQWSFLYSDRNAYQRDDQINIFGYAKYYNDETPNSLTLVLKSYFEEDVLQSQEVTLDKEHSFTGQFDIKDYAYGYYHVVLMDGETVLETTSMLVTNYEKPEVLLKGSIDPKVAFVGEKIQYTLKAEYFNELPYEGMKVGLIFDESKLDSTLTTDKNGEIKVEFTPEDTRSSWRPYAYSINANGTGIENNYISAYSNFELLSRDTMLLAKTEVLKNQVDVKVESHQIDLTNYVNGELQTLQGKALSKEIKATIVERYYEKIFVNKVYDPIHKLSYDKYKFENRQRSLESIYFNTVDGLGEFNFPYIEGRSYEITLTSEDGQGRLVTEQIYIYGGYGSWIDYTYMYGLEESEEKYVVGDQVKRSVLKFGDRFESDDKTYTLAMFLRNGLLDYQVIKGNEISFDFVKDFRPNILLKAVYFDGNQMYLLPKYGHSLMAYDYETLEGEIEVVGLEEKYLPGDKVSLEIQVKSASGQPFNGLVNVSVVDEAFFALYPDYFNLGLTLHSYVYSDGILNESTSSQVESDMGGAEAGGGGGDDGYIREEFVDTAHFETIEIKDGLGNVTMNLPDNLTKFRVTLQGVNGALEYATKKVAVNISLPYFIRHFYNMNYLVGDDVYLPVSSEGEDMTDDMSIQYSLYMNDKMINSFQAKGKSLVQLPLGVVDQDLKVKITGKSGDYFDGVVHDLKVNPFYLEFDFIRNIPLSLEYQPINIYNSSKVSFVNKTARDLQENLYNSISWDPVRLEEILARQEGQKLLSNYFGIEAMEDYDLKAFQGYGGGLKLLPTGDEDLETTALVAATKYGVNNFEKTNMINYLKVALYDKSTPANLKALTLWGLAAQGEPVLLSVNEFLNTYEFETLDLEARLYVIYALLEMKDKTRVKNLSADFFKDDELGNLSTEIYILGAALNERLKFNAGKYSLFDIDKMTSDESINMEKIYYLSQKSFDFSQVKMAYELNGKKTDVLLDSLKAHVVNLKKGDVFKVITNNEEVYLTEQYMVNALDEEKYKSKKLEMTKQYPSDKIQVGDLVPVTLTFDKPRDAYVILQDQVPAGFEYAGYLPNDNMDQHFYVENENQSLHMRYSSEADGGQVTYYIRAIQKGKYHVEPAAIYVYGSSDLYMTKTEVLEVE